MFLLKTALFQKINPPYLVNITLVNYKNIILLILIND
jgi:hypothetical protein